MKYGKVKITKGKHKGKTGLYDDDEGCHAIVYIDGPEPFVRVRYTSIEPLNENTTKEKDLKNGK